MSKKNAHYIASLFLINFPDNRVYGLDILRACAILFVVVGHGLVLLSANMLPGKIFGFMIFDGVSIFFVLSGYLIGGILLKMLHKHTANFGTLFDFWKRRWFRTVPTYFLILTILIFLAWCGKIYLLPPHVEKFYLFAQNINSAHPNFFNEAWSLSIEEWFYILIPLLLFIISGIFKVKIKPAFLGIAISIILLITLFRLYRFSHFPVKSIYGWDTFFRKEVITRFDSMMFGMLGAFFKYYNNTFFLKYKRFLFFTGLLMLLADKLISAYIAAIFQSVYQYVFSFTVVSLATLLLLPFLSEIKRGKGRTYKAITYISIASYSMYLVNYSLVLKFIIPFLVGQCLLISRYSISAYMQFSLFLLITAFLSALLYKYFEKPFTDLRDKI